MSNLLRTKRAVTTTTTMLIAGPLPEDLTLEQVREAMLRLLAEKSSMAGRVAKRWRAGGGPAHRKFRGPAG